jgi:membrane protease subunit (stomatin/prohibitin family)
MGLFSGIKNQFRSVIQWENPNPADIFFKWTDNGDEIKNASKLIVGPGQGCIFVYQGKVESVITEEGIVELATANVPFVTTLSRLMQGFKSEFKVGLYFFRTAKILNQKWGTPSIIKYQDPKYNFPVGLRAFGNYSFRITQPGPFFSQIIGASAKYTTEDFRQVMGSRIIQPLADFLAEKAYSYADIDRQRNEIAAGLNERLVQEFATLGFALEDFRIEGTSFDEDTMKRINRIADMNAESQAAAAAGLSYAQLQQLDAMKAAASNPSGGAGMGMGMGAGVGVGQMMAGSMATGGAPGAAPAAQDPMAKLAQLKKMLDGGLITQEEYDAKKKDILAAM